MQKTASKRLLDKNTRVSSAMGSILSARSDEILAQEAAVRCGDVEGTHAMRVAAKRAREAARVFRPALGRSRTARGLAHLETLNSALGHVRDLDVLALELHELAREEPLLAEGLEPLLVQLADKTETGYEALRGVLCETLVFLPNDLARLVKSRPKRRADVWKGTFIQFGCAAVARRTCKAFELEAAARVLGASQDFHRMRIAVKRAKYALELILPLLGKRVKTAYKDIAELQELMGRVHDADVLAVALQTAKADGTLKPSVANRALKLTCANRDRLFGDSIAHLDRMHEAGLPEKLLKALGQHSG